MDKISTKKQVLLDEFLLSPIVVGEIIYLESKPFKTYYVEGIEDDVLVCSVDENKYDKNRTIHRFPIALVKKRLGERFIGANPFIKSKSDIRFIAYQLSSILFSLGLGDEGREVKYHTNNGVPIQNINWNPFIVNKNGVREYYQRDFVWSIRDKQLLIDSIYHGIDCGKILVRKRSWGYNEELSLEGESGVSFHDIVDGKQRLNAIDSFIKGEYPDSYGNYYADLSLSAQHNLTNHQLFSYAEMSEDTTDEEVLEQFLKLNFSGVPQSEEHIQFVQSILNRAI